MFSEVKERLTTEFLKSRIRKDLFLQGRKGGRCTLYAEFLCEMERRGIKVIHSQPPDEHKGEEVRFIYWDECKDV